MAEKNKHKSPGLLATTRFVLGLAVIFVWESAMSGETVFGIVPRARIPPVLASNVAENIFLPGALHLRFGMTREEVFKTCPSLEYDAEFVRKYFLRYTQPVILQNQLKGIEFSGGFPKPSQETVNTTVEWLLGVFGPPTTAFEKPAPDGGRIGLIWKRNDFSVACWFSSIESGKSFYAYLKLVSTNSNMERILSASGGRDLPKTSQGILASLGVWSRTVATLESKGAHLSLAKPIPTGPPAPSIALLEKYEVLSGEGLSGSGFVIQHRNSLYGVCSLHQFDGEVPGSFEPIQGTPVPLDKARVIRQKDVQVVPVRFPQPKIQFLTYRADFTLRPGEEVYVLGPAGGVELGMLATTQMEGGSYRSTTGPKQFTVRMAKPFVAAGGSGCPIIQKATGAVVGVLLSANDG